MESKRRQVIMLWDAWSDATLNKLYAIYYLIDIKSSHAELIFSEKDIKHADKKI